MYVRENLNKQKITHLNMRRKILVFTGAGIDAESGIKTFRDSGGLWHEFKVEEVAHIDGWNKNPQLCIDFYNLRRKEMNGVMPNDAHRIIAELEKNFDVTVVTQNVSDLHEKAGSTNVIHLHGEISKLRSEYNCDTKKDFDEEIKLGDVCDEGGQWRPDVVFFGEDLDHDKIEATRQAAEEASVCIIVGTSMQVSPANSIPWMTDELCLIYYIDPSDIDFTIPKWRKSFFYHIQKPASLGMEEVRKDLEEIFL